MSITHAYRRFPDIFRGSNRGYGTAAINEGTLDERGKLRAKHQLIHRPPTAADFERHLNGDQSIGIMPIDEQGLAYWGCLDIDNYSPEAHEHFKLICRAIKIRNMPLIATFSKSKGLHIFIFILDGTTPDRLIELLSGYIPFFGLSDKTEIYPAQKSVREGNQFYSWVNLPYFGNTQQMLDEKFETRTADEFVIAVDQVRLDYKQHCGRYIQIPYWDAPPCIKAGSALLNIPEGYRNNFLFSAAVYWRTKDESEDIETHIKELNDALDIPIDEQRLEQTVLSSVHKKTYFYKCSALLYCNKAICRQTEYGIESKRNTGFEYSDMEMIMTDPPHYRWNVNGVDMYFYSEVELLHQEKFQVLCLRDLGKVPRTVPEASWKKILNRSLANRTIKKVENLAGSFGTGSEWLRGTIGFFYNRRNGEDDTGLDMGRTFEDKKNSRWIFSTAAYIQYLRGTRNFRGYTDLEIQVKIQQLGAQPYGEYWALSYDSLSKQPEQDMVIDFRDREEEGDVY